MRMSEPKNIYDKFVDDGLFTAMGQQGYTFPFETSLTMEDIDALYINTFGYKRLSRIARSFATNYLAKYIIGIYGNSWNEMWNCFIANKELANGDKESYEEVKVTDDTVANDRTTLNQVSAFNDDGEEETTSNEETSSDDEEIDYFVDNDNSKVTSNTQTDREQSKEYVKISLKADNRADIMELLQTEFLHDIIFVDVNKLLTLSII